MCFNSRSSLYVLLAWMMDWKGRDSFFTAIFRLVFSSNEELFKTGRRVLRWVSEQSLSLIFSTNYLVFLTIAIFSVQWKLHFQLHVWIGLDYRQWLICSIDSLLLWNRFSLMEIESGAGEARRRMRQEENREQKNKYVQHSLWGKTQNKVYLLPLGLHHSHWFVRRHNI